MLAEAVELGPVEPASSEVAPALGPTIRPDHLLTLVDDVGIVQHANGVVPDRSTGYCVDDVARLAVVALGLDRRAQRTALRPDAALGTGLPAARLGLPTPDGMHNFMTYDRRWLDDAARRRPSSAGPPGPWVR